MMKKQQQNEVYKKRFGQHFLNDSDILNRIIQTIRPQPKERIVEIGPGKGILTEKLIKNMSMVTGVEIDRDLISVLNSKFKGNPYFQLIHQDILQFIPHFDAPYKLVGNIPYNLTTKLFEKILMWKNKPSSITFLIQKEVGEKIVQKGEKNSPLAVCVAMIGEPHIVLQISPEVFIPPPKVDSVLIEIDCEKAQQMNIAGKKGYAAMNNLDIENQEWQFYDFVHKIFRMPRKTLHNNLASFIEKNKIPHMLYQSALDGIVRPEKLSFEQLHTLFMVYMQGSID